jgi:hypothetical protein
MTAAITTSVRQIEFWSKAETEQMDRKAAPESGVTWELEEGSQGTIETCPASLTGYRLPFSNVHSRLVLVVVHGGHHVHEDTELK